ncbi:hypothetical protein NDU88_001374 [Pleurodeles waltl]|uniref:Uncharacterized protein n=1 Tax=Pleurodeles waltl TaxID=8319 RepID=A0AAV7NEK1_PLEWA|nr:hypothetical protein NDU88_001374 [Pleurodeles waltl]
MHAGTPRKKKIWPQEEKGKRRKKKEKEVQKADKENYGGRKRTLHDPEPKRGFPWQAMVEKTGCGPKNGPQQDWRPETRTAHPTAAYEGDAAGPRSITLLKCTKA